MLPASKPVSKILMTIIMGFTTSMVTAQQTATATPASSSASPDNTVAILMGIIALVLAFVIWGMGQVLITLGKQVLDKNKSASRALPILLFAVFNLLSFTSQAQDQAAATTTAPLVNYGGMGSTGFWMLATVLALEFIVISFMLFFIRRIQVELMPEPVTKKAMFSWKTAWAKLDKRFFTRAVAVEKEADVMLDHDYDGIRELDNALPPWWKYGFAITIVVAFIYMLNFHVLGYGKNPTEEYLAEIEKAKEDKAIYDAKNADKIDENNLKMPSLAGINAGKNIYVVECWACHGKTGEGGAGPNLTDDYWIHKGSLADVYASIKHGYPDKGMRAWENNFSPKDILHLAGFVKSMRGSNPANPKPPQGDLYTEIPATDSTAVQANDSTTNKTSAGASGLHNNR
jgi:cytochrome c oxidase cbb3-type subunit 3